MYLRRAQGLSISTLILVTLGILILAISIFFFTNVVDSGRGTINNCENLGGTCQLQCGAGESHNLLGDRSCEENNQICCVSRNT